MLDFKISFPKVDLALEAKSVERASFQSCVARYPSVLCPISYSYTCFPAPEEKTSAPRNPMSSFLAPTSGLKNLMATISPV